MSKVAGLRSRRLIIRKSDTKQRQASAAVGLKQAREAFECVGDIDPDVPYLVIDDVITTGATIKYAVKALKKAGAKHIFVAAIAKQM